MKGLSLAALVFLGLPIAVTRLQSTPIAGARVVAFRPTPQILVNVT